jgi:hypothetical protein
MATKTVSVDVAYNEVVCSVESIKNDEHAVIATMSPGDVLRQGDCYVIALDREIPGGKPTSRQLAPGNTQGSRHIAEGDCDVLSVPEAEAIEAINRMVPATKGQTLFVGPMIRARGSVRIVHPEHGDRTIPGDACYLVTIQRTWAQEIRRTMD